MKKLTFPIIVIALFLIGWWFFSQEKTVPPPPTVEPPSVSAEDTPIVHPIPAPQTPTSETDADEETPPPAPLPALDDSDEPFQSALSNLMEPMSLDEVFVSTDSIRRLTVTLDNLTESKLPLRLLPLKLPAGQFAVEKVSDKEFVLDPANYQRYDNYITLAERFDSQQLPALYVRFYPLFQQAYVELGYPDGYFNDRLVTVIDHLLATPEIEGPVKLVQPKVFYQFADPQLEALSAGQKLLIRIGPKHAARIKQKLRELRGEIASQATGE